MQGKIPFIFYTIEKFNCTHSIYGKSRRRYVLKRYVERIHRNEKIVKYGSVHIFVTGKHPAIVSNAKKFTKLVLTF